MGAFGSPYIDSFNRSNQYGDVVLKSLQNDNIPELDLFIREAVQNSSDASLKTDKKNVSIDFTCRKFNCAALNKHMSGITEVLAKRFPYEEAIFIEARDTGTVGLTGHTD